MNAAKKVAASTIAGGYLLCFLCPIFGFVAGIYLLIKGETGHGLACMLLSFVVPMILVLSGAFG